LFRLSQRTRRASLMNAVARTSSNEFQNEALSQILIADDDPSFRESLQRLLVQWGYQVKTVGDGNRAWEMVQANPPDLVLLDWTMPGCNGLELCRRIRALQDPHPTYVILVTGRAATEDSVAGLEAGADDYITKPVEFLSFRARIKVGVRMAKLQQQLADRARVLEETLAETRQLELDAAEGRQREHFLAFHDSLTGLPNRQLFVDRLEQTIAHTQRNRQIAAVLFLDLNGYKEINDTIGHCAGDQLLGLVAQRLKACLRESDTVARLGGDEFGVIASGLSRQVDAEVIAVRILESLSDTFTVDNQTCTVGASIGISLWPSDAEDVETIIRRADIAMYRAKRQGKNSFVFYNRSPESGLQDRVLIENDLREALVRNEFVLHYQPQVSMRPVARTGVEALVRWQRPRSGLLFPKDFLPVAEETGLIVPLGRWVLRTACRQAAIEQTANNSESRMAVHLSGRQFRGANLLQTIKETLEETCLRASALELEISEKVAMQNIDHSLKTMAQLKDIGVCVALDDFGTGFSSLSSLKRFPIDNLKIDRSHVRGLPNDQENAVITSAIISMAHRLRVGVIADGVETAEQWRYLRSLGCDEAQGDFLGSATSLDRTTLHTLSGLSDERDLPIARELLL
jgi:diguanylate cyclase (GGDEF)-like protein